MAPFKRTIRVGLLVAGLSGCGTGALKEAAAVDLPCAESVEVTRGKFYATASGCGKAAYYVYQQGKWVSPLDRASFDLSCDKKQLSMTAVDASTVGVSGCGKRSAYVAVNEQGVGGRWVMNSASVRPEAPESATPKDAPPPGE